MGGFGEGLTTEDTESTEREFLWFVRVVVG
jgi:hypothetical protein